MLQVQYVIRPKKASHHDYRGFAGKVNSGHFKTGDPVLLAPSGQKSKIERIEKYGEEIFEVAIGENATFILSDALDASRGSTIYSTNASLESTQHVEAHLCWMQKESLAPQKKYWLQNGVNRVLTQVTAIDAKMNISSHTKEPSAFLECNDIGQVSLRLAQPILKTSFSENKNFRYLLGVSYITANLCCICVSACFMFA